MTPLADGLAALGSPWLLGPLALLAGFVAVRRARSIRPGVYLAGTALGGFAIEWGIHRLDAAGMLHRVTAAAGPSFPSGHTIAAVSVYGGAAFVRSRRARPWKVRVGWCGSAAVAVLLVAASRVWLGDRPVPDVAVSVAVGAAWLALTSLAEVAWHRLGHSPELRRARNRAVSRTLRWGLTVVSVGIALHVVLLALPGIRRSVSTLRHAEPLLVLVAVALETGSLACLGQLWRQSLAALGTHIPYRDSERIAVGMFAVAHVVPVGGAAAGVWGARELTALGVDAATAMTSVAVGSVTAMVTLGAVVFLGAAVSLSLGEISARYAAAIVLTLAVLAAAGAVVWKAIRSEKFRNRIFSLTERGLGMLHVSADVGPWREAAAGIVPSLSHRGRALAIVRWSAANWLLDLGALWTMFAAFRHPAHLGLVVVGYGVANLVAALPVTPGGIGLVEAGLAATYTAFGVPGSVAVVVVLAYRLISFWLPVLSGIPVYLGARRRAAEPVAAGG